MKIFIFEHICGGGLSQIELTTGLIREGGAMLGALVEDALAAGHDVVTTLDQRVSMPKAFPLLRAGLRPPGPRGRLDVLPVHAGQPIMDVFKHAIHGCTAALIVAPEFDDLLYHWQMRIGQMDHAGVANLGSKPVAVQLVSDKFQQHQVVRKHGIPAPDSYVWNNQNERDALERPRLLELFKQFPDGLVIKPRFGAGCQDTFVCRAEADLAKLPIRQNWLVQNYVAGKACSAAFLVHKGHISPLRAGLQQVAPDAAGKMAYRGGRMPLEPELEVRALALGERAVASIPGLGGFVGVDLILGQTAADDVVIEINPRPTVAYTGLRQLSSVNLISRLLDPHLPPAWHPLSVGYTSDGNVVVSP